MIKCKRRLGNSEVVLIFLSSFVFICSVWAKSPSPYAREVLGDFRIKEWKLKPKYSSQSKQILNNIKLFSNLSSHEPFFGGAGDKPWSWRYSACEANPLVTSKKDKKFALTKYDFYQPTSNFKSLYNGLKVFSELQCLQTQILADDNEKKVPRLLNIVPATCKLNFIKKFKTDKDAISWQEFKRWPFGKAIVSAEQLDAKTLSRWYWLLSCTSDELYPSNSTLDKSISEYIGFFDRLTIQSAYDEQCIVDLKKAKKEFLKIMSTQCPKPIEP